MVKQTGSANAAGLIAAAVRRRVGVSDSQTSSPSRPRPSASAATRKRRRGRSAASGGGADNEPLGRPPEDGAGSEADRTAEDDRSDERRVIRMDGVARPEDQRRAESRRGRQRERPVGLRDRTEPI